MDTLKQVLSIISENGNAINVIATVVVAAAACVTLYLTIGLVRDNRALRKAGTEPELVAYLSRSEAASNHLDFTIANVGKGAAFDIYYEFKCDLDLLKKHEVKFPYAREFRRFSVLPSGDKITSWFGSGPELLSEPPLPPFLVELKYKNSRGKSFTTRSTLNVKEFEGISVLRDSTYPVEKASLKAIADTLSSWSTRATFTKRLGVQIVTQGEAEEESKAAREEIERYRKDQES